MIWLNKTNVNLMIQMVKDLEKTRETYRGYSYVRTIRNILVGNENAVIAKNFTNKPYYGMFTGLTLSETEHRMDALVRCNELEVVYTDHGKLWACQVKCVSSFLPLVS